MTPFFSRAADGINNQNSAGLSGGGGVQIWTPFVTSVTSTIFLHSILHYD